MSTETGAGAAGEDRMSSKCRKQRGDMSTRQKQPKAEAGAECVSKKIRLRTNSHSTESCISAGPHAGQIQAGVETARVTVRIQPQQPKQQLPREHKHQWKQQQQMKQQQQSSAPHGTEENAHASHSKRMRKASDASHLPLASIRTASSHGVAPHGAGDAAVRVSRRSVSSCADGTPGSEEPESARCAAAVANSSGSEAGTREADTQSELGRAVSLKDGRTKTKKRKRRDCWDLATVAEQKTQLLQQLKGRDAKEKLSKSRLKRLKARLSLLAKAERGEVQVGGQLLPSGKRRKLLEKIKRRKEERKNVGVGDTAEKRKLGKFKRNARVEGRVRNGNSDAALAKKKRIKKICLNCRKRGHLLENCPGAVPATCCPAVDYDDSTVSGASRATLRPAMSGICFNCGSKEHTLRNCKKPRNAEGTLPFALCFVCGKDGHISSQCPDSKTGKYPKGGCCRTCGSIFHLQADCPELKNYQATNTAAGREASHAKDTAVRSRRDPKQRQSSSFPLTVSHRRDDEVDPDEYWGN